MSCLLGWIVLLLLSGTECALSEQPNAEDTGPLFLTPLIKEGKIKDAKNKSHIPFFKNNFSVDAFSGYITVNETANSSLFFLLVKAPANKTNAPLLLWTQGGPGLSALFGQFLENGPVAYDPYKNFTQRTNTLQNNMSVLYVDLPVGAGFSFTNDPSAYPKSLENITDSVMVFLAQFLKLFPEYICRDFYVGGESYAARYSVDIAHRILNNPKNITLVLKGTIGGNGFLGPILDLADSSEFLYQTSMLDEKGRDKFSKQFEIMRDLKRTNISLVPLYLSYTLFVDFTGKNPTLFQNLTQYSDYMSPLNTTRPLSVVACFRFLNESVLIRDLLHIGRNAKFEYYNEPLLWSLSSDYMADISTIIEALLNISDVLFYTGQMDALFPAVNQHTYLNKLNWSKSDDYRLAERQPWYLPTSNIYSGFAGYVKRVPNFTDATLLGMSHYGAVEKPDEVYYLIIEFMRNLSSLS